LLLVLVTFALGCAAGPAREGAAGVDADKGEAGSAATDLETEPKSWAEALDEAVFGASEPAGPRPAAGPESSPPSSKEASLRRKKLRELSTRALLAQRLGRLEAAIPPLENALRLLSDEERGPYQRALGDVYLSLHRDQEAVRMYRDAMSSNGDSKGDSMGSSMGSSTEGSTGRHPGPPQSEALLGNLAVACYRLGDLAAARQAAGMALEIRPRYPEALKTLGLIDLREGEQQRGIERVEAALRSDPTIPEAHVALAEAFAGRGDYPRALEHYRSLLQLHAAQESMDYSRRWRDLFYPGGKSTAEELRERIGRLEAMSAGKSAGSAAQPDQREREP
jgi:tetratricopeptide (TPR) repeat protein